jgi:nucleoside-diphosphate-sugar epimerase
LYLVTGGAGFIGSNIVESLVGEGAAVRVLDNLSNGIAANLEPFKDSIEFVEGDIRDAEACRRAADGVEVVLHLAALGSVPRSIDDPDTSNRVNVDGTLNMLIAARDAGARRLVFSSSSSVYGENPALPKREDMATLPISPYAVSKLAGESYTRVFSRVYEIETVCLRYFNVFGPRQRPDAAYAAVIPLFMRAAVDKKPLSINGDGEQSRDFTFVANVVRANLLAAEAPAASGNVYNIACGERYSLLDIAETIEDCCGYPLEREHGAARAGDVRHSQADISAAERDLGYTTAVGFAEGMAATWRGFYERFVSTASSS